MAQEIIIYITHSADKQVQLTIPSDKTKELTCHWLLEQAILKLNQTFPQQGNFDDIVALCTVNREYAVDHWLTLPYKNLSILRSGMILKPFYKQVMESEKKKDEFYPKVSLNDFLVEIQIGCGAFAKVYLVRKKDTGALYALKKIWKGDLNDKKKKLIMRERQAMLDLASSSHVVSLRYAFQTENHCYFVQDFIPYGDMHHVISRRKLSENEARYYVAETILGLDAIHKANYIYRDLKPENILLDLDGHIRITDFGLVKKVDHAKILNYSYCGTYEIMAPEIIADKEYNFMVDYYNIGTLAYELVTGKIPHLSEKKREFLKENDLAIQNLSDEFKDFIKKLLETRPQNRLGAIEGLKEICSHPWLRSINMSDINERNIKPPLILDPNYIHFKSKSLINEDIDKLSWENMPLQTSLDNMLVNFSFYGIKEISLDFNLIPSIEKNFDSKMFKSAEKRGTLSFPASLIQSGNSIAKTNLYLEKSDDMEEEFRTTEMRDEESLAVKVANYKTINKWSLSFIEKLALMASVKSKNTLI